MMYFWFIPVLILLVGLLWGLYASATRRAPHRTDGRTVLDKETPNRRERG